VCAHGFGSALNYVKNRDAIRGTTLACKVAGEEQYQHKHRGGSTHSLLMHKSVEDKNQPKRWLGKASGLHLSD
jgi:hypothetical protein